MIDPPEAILARLGSSPKDLSGAGPCRVLRGNDLVAKLGPEDRIAREAFLLGEASALIPVDLPVLVDSGPGWILMEDAGDRPAASDDVRPMARLAPMHELFVGATGIEHERFRDVFGRERDALLGEARASAAAATLPPPLASTLADPTPLVVIVEAEPRTLVHGDARPGNVLADGPNGFIWLDWEESGAGPAALDLARWLHGSTKALGSPHPEGDLGAYVVGCAIAVDPGRLRRAVDAAAVLAFLLLDLAALGTGDPAFSEGIVERRNELVLSLDT